MALIERKRLRRDGMGLRELIVEPAIRLFRGQVRIEETWFTQCPPRTKADIVRLQQSPIPVPGARNRPVHTIVIDLTASEEALWSDVRKNTRYEIRRAEKEGVWHRDEAPRAGAAAFADAYAGLQARKALWPLNRARLDGLAAVERLRITTSRGTDGAALTWHVYVCANGQARLLHSVSEAGLSASPENRNLVARANRLHHWKDMLLFKVEGIKSYDLGGWYAGEADQEKLRINQFKESFGGCREQRFNALLPLTLRGWVVAKAFQLVDG